MADGERIAKAYVAIEADLSAVPAGMNKLSSTVTSKIVELQRKIGAQIARNRLDMKVAINAGNFRDIERLGDAQDRLKIKMNAVNQAALNQAAALRAINAAGKESTRPTGFTPRPGGGSGGLGGAMGLMMLSQAVDDAQYGFRALLNQIPMLGTALGQTFGMGAEKAMKFGSILGIVSVALNYVINHWEQWAQSLGLFSTEATRTINAIEALQTRIRQLEEKPAKLAIDSFELDQAKKRLNELQAAAEAFKKMGETQSPEEKASGEAVQKTFGELSTERGDEIQSGLKGRMVNELTATSESIKEADREVARAEEAQRKTDLRLQQAGGFGGVGAQRQALEEAESAKERVAKAKEAAAQARREIDKEGGEAEREIGRIWADAAKGNVESQKELIRRLNEIGEAALAESIGKVAPGLAETPEMKKKAAEAKREAEADESHEMEASNMLRERRIAEDSRLANAMMGSVGQKFLKNPEMTDEALQDEVKTAMAKAGVNFEDVAEAAEGVAKNIRDRINSQITERALGRDDQSQEKAREDLIKQAQAKDDKSLPKAEVLSTESYLNKVLVAGLKPKDDTAKEQLQVAKSTDKTLDKILKEVSKPQKAIPAVFGPGR